MKNKKMMIIIAISVLIILLILLIISSTLKKKNIAKNNVIDKNVINNTEIPNNEKNSITQNTFEGNNTVIKTANELFKECLLDSDWVKQNLYMKTDCFGKIIPSNTKQNVKYIKISDIVLVYTECDTKISNQLYYLTYNNGNIMVNSINQNSTHNSHTIYNVNGRNKVLYKLITYSDYEEYHIFNITNTGLQKNCIIKKQNIRKESNFESECHYNDEKISEKEYDAIKNKYIQVSARGEEFKILSSENLNNSFPD